MAQENLVVVPRTDLIIEVPPMAQVPAAPLDIGPPSTEHIQVIDRVFTHNSGDNSAMALFGAWGCVMLLHDLAADHFSRPKDLDERPGDLPRPDDEPDGEPTE
jgi:hypothetical protein